MGNATSASANGLGKKSSAKDVVDHFAAAKSIPATELLKDKLAVVTGGNSGIGAETVKALAYAGARVVLASRDVKSGEAAVLAMSETPGDGGYVVPNAKNLVTVKQLDLSSLSSIQKFAAELAGEPKIDFLVNNAGVMATPTLEHTVNGFEKQIGTNHFGHFYLTKLLLPKVVAAPAGRIVCVSSDAHKMVGTSMYPFTLDDLHFKSRAYGPWIAYGASKLSNILFVKELADQLAGTKVVAVSLHPGVIKTNLQRTMGGVMSTLVGWVSDKTIPQGASTSITGCLDPSLEQHRGAYLSDCAVALPNAVAQDVDGTMRKALWATTQAQIDEALNRPESTAAAAKA